MIKERFISAIIGTLFFAVFQPFGISHFGMYERLLISGSLLIVAFASCMTCEGVIKYILRMPHDTTRGPEYMMKRGIAFQFCNILTLTVYMSLFFDRFVNNGQVDNHLSIDNCLGFFVASICCCFFIGLYWRNVYWKRHYAKLLEEAQLLNGVLMERVRNAEVRSLQTISTEESVTAEEQVILEGNTKESLSMVLSDFLFAESDGNYVSVHHIENGEEKRKMLNFVMNISLT